MKIDFPVENIVKSRQLFLVVNVNGFTILHVKPGSSFFIDLYFKSIFTISMSNGVISTKMRKLKTNFSNNRRFISIS